MTYLWENLVLTLSEMENWAGSLDDVYVDILKKQKEDQSNPATQSYVRE